MRFIITVFLLSVFGSAFAQGHTPRGFCGTHGVDMDALKEAKALGKQIMATRGSNTILVPVRFKLIGESDSTNAANPHNVLDLMASMNVDFGQYDFQLYLDNTSGLPWDTYYSDVLYSDHSSQTNALRGLSTRNAVSVFVPEDANTGSGLGTTLGYYSPSLDILVFRKSEVNADASTASHEFGHFFSLPHTFLGWDRCAWNGQTTAGCFTPEISSPVTRTLAPSGQHTIELVTRDAGSNCGNAGDTFCDTQADYNFGFGWNNCDYTGGVEDANGDLLIPDEDNFMGYFLNCTPYRFSDEQVTAMVGNYNSGARSRIRGFTPDVTDPIPAGDINWIAPAEDNSTTQWYDEVRLNWQPVPNAQWYYVEVARSQSFSQRQTEFTALVSTSNITLTTLSPNQEYFYRIRPFSQISFGQISAARSFTTSAFVSGTNSVPEAAKSVVLAPNPIAQGQALQLTIESQGAGSLDVSLADLTGRVLSQRREQLVVGENSFYVNEVRDLPSGAYLLTLTNEKGISTRKFVVD